MYGTIFQERALGSVIFFMALGLAFFHAPFVACNLYYFFANEPCTYSQILGFDIAFNLRVWLQVDAYTCIGFLTILLILAVLSCLSIDKPNYLTAYTIITTVFGIFRTVWLIVGAVMFWGYLCPNNICNVGFARYMWANLIIGFIATPIYYLLGYTYPRVTSVPVKVQLAQTNLTTHPTTDSLKNHAATNNTIIQSGPNVQTFNQPQNMHQQYFQDITPRSIPNTLQKPTQSVSLVQYPAALNQNQQLYQQQGIPHQYPRVLPPLQQKLSLPVGSYPNTTMRAL